MLTTSDKRILLRLGNVTSGNNNVCTEHVKKCDNDYLTFDIDLSRELKLELDDECVDELYKRIQSRLRSTCVRRVTYHHPYGEQTYEIPRTDRLLNRVVQSFDEMDGFVHKEMIDRVERTRLRKINDYWYITSLPLEFFPSSQVARLLDSRKILPGDEVESNRSAVWVYVPDVDDVLPCLRLEGGGLLNVKTRKRVGGTVVFPRQASFLDMHRYDVGQQNLVTNSGTPISILDILTTCTYVVNFNTPMKPIHMTESELEEMMGNNSSAGWCERYNEIIQNLITSSQNGGTPCEGIKVLYLDDLEKTKHVHLTKEVFVNSDRRHMQTFLRCSTIENVNTEKELQAAQRKAGIEDYYDIFGGKFDMMPLQVYRLLYAFICKGENCIAEFIDQFPFTTSDDITDFFADVVVKLTFEPNKVNEMRDRVYGMLFDEDEDDDDVDDDDVSHDIDVVINNIIRDPRALSDEDARNRFQVSFGDYITIKESTTVRPNRQPRTPVKQHKNAVIESVLQDPDMIPLTDLNAASAGQLLNLVYSENGMKGYVQLLIDHLESIGFMDFPFMKGYELIPNYVCESPQIKPPLLKTEPFVTIKQGEVPVYVAQAISDDAYGPPGGGRGIKAELPEASDGKPFPKVDDGMREPQKVGGGGMKIKPKSIPESKGPRKGSQGVSGFAHLL